MAQLISPYRLQIWEIEFGQQHPAEMSNRHPAVLVSCQSVINSSDAVTVVPGTSQEFIYSSPLIIAVDPTDSNGLKKTTYFKTELIRSIDIRKRATGFIGNLDPQIGFQLDQAIRLALDI